MLLNFLLFLQLHRPFDGFPTKKPVPVNTTAIFLISFIMLSYERLLLWKWNLTSWVIALRSSGSKPEMGNAYTEVMVHESP